MRSPSRTTWWSSAMSTRTGPRCRSPRSGLTARSSASGGTTTSMVVPSAADESIRIVAADRGRPLAHGEQAEAAHLHGVLAGPLDRRGEARCRRR